MRRADLIGWAALFALAALSPSRPPRAAVPVALPAPRPRGPRPNPKPDATVAAGHVPMTWALVQSAPTLQVLATSDDRARLVAEMAELFAIWGERRDRRTHAWVVVPVDALPVCAVG